MKKAINFFLSLVSALAVLAGAFGSGYYCGTHNLPEAEAVVQTVYRDIMIPTEVEKRVVTKEEVETRLVEIGELSTYAGEYTVNKAVDQTRYLLDSWGIPGSTNSIDLTCTGIVKVGYDINKINVRVDNASQTIYIALPEAKLNDNYVIWDTIECIEKNTILNPIEFSQYQQLITEIEEAGLQQVLRDGIYDLAEENVKNIILNFLACFEEFEIVFL